MACDSAYDSIDLIEQNDNDEGFGEEGKSIG